MTENRPLTESFETTGEWFLPDSPQRRIAGTVSFKAGRTELRLHSTLRPLPRGTMQIGSILPPYQVIYGDTRDGDAMTLINGQHFGMGFKLGSAGLRTPERVLTNLALVGGHVAVDARYTEMFCRIPGLQVWLSRKAIHQAQEKDETTGATSQVFRVLDIADEVTAVPAMDGNVVWRIDSQVETNFHTAVSVSTSGWLRMQPRIPQPLDWFFAQLGKITTLLSFLSASPMSPDYLRVPVPPNRLASVLVNQREPYYCTFEAPNDFYMPRAMMVATLSDVVARWFDIYPKVEMPSQLALSVMNSKGLWPHVEFLSLMQALEGLHRACYGKQVALAKRLEELTSKLSGDIRKAIFGPSAAVPREWIHTRNYYTHWDEKLRPKILDGQRMVYANVRMRHFLRALYLDLVGIPQDAIRRALGNTSGDSQYLLQINGREFQQMNQSVGFGTITVGPHPPKHHPANSRRPESGGVDSNDANDKAT